MLHSLRKQLQCPDVILGTTELRLNDERIQSDIGFFRDLISRGELAEAVGNVGGLFLDGVFLPGVDDFERWLDAERKETQRQHVAALRQLAKEAEARADSTALIGWLRKVQTLDACNGQAALDLINALEMAGDTAGALQQAVAHQLALKDELGAPPNAAVAAAAKRLSERCDIEDAPRDRAGPTSAAVSAPTRDAEAYELYLKGRYLWTQRTRTKLEQALGYFQRAVERDPDFSLAYVAMADAYVNMSNFGHMPTAIALAHAGAAADRAIMLDPSLSEPHASKGFVLTSTGKLQEAEASFRRSIEINPSYPSAHHFYTLLLTITGRLDAAEAENAIALKLNPLSLGANAHRGVLSLMRNDTTGARAHFQYALSLSPGFPLALAYTGDLDASEERYDDALRSLERAQQTGPRFPGVVPALSYAYSHSGRSAEAAGLMSQMKRDATDDRSRINLGLAYAMNGDLNSSFSILKGLNWDVPTRMALRASPLVQGLRQDPRYLALG
jgi:tetratricopeptide (TPR) repeat protein